MGWILNIVALILFALVSLIDQIVRLSQKRSGDSAYKNGLNINVFANYLYKNTFNLFLLKKEVNYFGRFGEPISSVLGRAYVNDKLNYFGHVIRFVVDFVDFKKFIKGESHCIDWIRSDKELENYKNEL